MKTNLCITAFRHCNLAVALALTASLASMTARADAPADPVLARLSALETAVSVLKTNRIPVGTILPFAGGTLPSHYLAADGKVVDEEHDASGNFAALCSTIRDQFRLQQDPVGICRLPDLRGRAPIGEGQGDGLSTRLLGQMLGEERHTLTLEEIPAHQHDENIWMSSDEARGYGASTNQNGFGDRLMVGWGASGRRLSGPAGGNQPHNLMQPSVVVKYVIKY